MADKKSETLWRVNQLSFVLLAVLALTGLTNWLLLPRGYGAGGADIWVSARHLLRFVHTCTAVLFIVTIGVHLGLHGSYLKKMLKERRRLKSIP